MIQIKVIQTLLLEDHFMTLTAQLPQSVILQNRLAVLTVNVFNMYDDGRIYGRKPSLEEPSPKVSFVNKSHDDLALGKKIPQTEAPTTNKYMHSRYTIEDIDGDANVYVKQEAQSDAYGLGKDQKMMAARVSGTDQGSGMNNLDGIQYEFNNITQRGDESLHARINSGDFEAVGEMLKTRGTSGQGRCYTII